ncbi:DUF6252 family protein [Mucilaginibacter sp.]|uniref:DUF6252 family protein n=1 Tax=Mucilaginibacter sp. TaxID=1882438 RepID=UPI00261E5B52|nr:DUF6252 family protein [Mucilaginibacter sp.]MDB4923176.1 hypothetical protein [Mucilaginibacter sp.]
MKRIKPVLFLLILCILAFNSCKKSGSSPTNAINISLKINGTAKTSSAPVADYIVSEKSLQIMGAFGTEGVSIMIQNVKVGTFDVAKDEAIMTYSVKPDFQYTYLGTTGKVTITSFTDTTVAGTFAFSGTDMNGLNGVVTEGKFQAKLYKQ